MTEMKSSLKKFFKNLRGETNILVLGETGVGKSTFINSLANYFAYENLEEAEVGETVCLIPTTFTVTNEKFIPTEVVFGSDKNESNVVGESKTQSTRCYNFNIEEKVLRLIDTPGIGDTRGIDYDKKNFDDILKFISVFSSLQGIIILLKPNITRLSIAFRFCFQELLSHLHKDASKNIVFVFTHSRETSYKPGETASLLKRMLAETREKEPHVDIPLCRETMYCLDNESFRFLLAIKSNITFDESDRLSSIQSWKTSVKEFHRLIKYITALVPHSVSDTTSLNQVRAQFIALAKPLADITQNIQAHLTMLNEHKLKIEKAGTDITQLKQVLYVPSLDLVIKKFDEPRTVCASPSCCKSYTIDGVRNIDYVQVCHNPCKLKNIAAEIINNVELKKCSAIEDATGNCRHCKCSWTKHMHIYYEFEHKIKKTFDTNIQKEISNKEAIMSNIAIKLKEIKEKVKSLEAEQKKISLTSAKFTYYLKKNSIIPYNNAQLQYIDYQIENEEQADQNKELLERLKKQRDQYKKELDLLEATTLTSHEFDTSNKENLPNYLDDLSKELYNLPISGNSLKEMTNITQTAQRRELSMAVPLKLEEYIPAMQKSLDKR